MEIVKIDDGTFTVSLNAAEIRSAAICETGYMCHAIEWILLRDPSFKEVFEVDAWLANNEMTCEDDARAYWKLFSVHHSNTIKYLFTLLSRYLKRPVRELIKKERIWDTDFVVCGTFLAYVDAGVRSELNSEALSNRMILLQHLLTFVEDDDVLTVNVKFN